MSCCSRFSRPRPLVALIPRLPSSFGSLLNSFHLHRCEIDLPDLHAVKRQPNTRILVKYRLYECSLRCFRVCRHFIVRRPTRSEIRHWYSRREFDWLRNAVQRGLIVDCCAMGIDCGGRQAAVEVRDRQEHPSSFPTRSADVTAFPCFDSHKGPK